MSAQLHVLILGYGEMGHAMEYLLGKQHRLSIWQRRPHDGSPPLNLEKVAAEADVILFCLPAIPHQAVTEQIAPVLRPDTLCLSIAKGLDEKGQCAAQVFQKVFAERQPYALLYGPMISEEIRAGRPAFAQVGCREAVHYHKVHQLFAGTSLYLQHTTDVLGISWAVILKNVYAIIFGAADELQLGDNVRGHLTVAALAELNQIVEEMGGKALTPYSLAGLGDLITTATSADSHHHELGQKLARGEMEGIEGEGIHTLQMVMQHELFDVMRYPLFRLVAVIVHQPKDVAGKFQGYLQRVYE